MDKMGKFSEEMVVPVLLALKVRMQGDLAIVRNVHATETGHVLEHSEEHFLEPSSGHDLLGLEAALMEIERSEHGLRAILIDQVLQVAFKLQKEGVISCPPLEWDGELGPEEEKVIERLGFLLNAYSVQTWWWELVEMLRKFILTVGLPVYFKGSPPQLGLSLVLVFLYLLAHILMKPMLNQGLNIFTQLSFISQFFTIFGALMFIVAEYMDLTSAGGQDGSSKAMIGFLVIALNVGSMAVFPLYRAWDAYSESGAIDKELIKKHARNAYEKMIPNQCSTARLSTPPRPNAREMLRPEETTMKN